MKKLYKKNSTVHPSSPSSTHLHLILPAAIFTLTLTLTPQDKEILSYLISNTTTTFTTTTHHSPLFTCNCFSCYMTYWVRWDTSPNRHLIHQILDAFEDSLIINNKNKTKKHTRNKTKKQLLLPLPLPLPNINDINESEDLHLHTTGVAESTSELTRSTELSQVNEFEDGPVRKLMSFIGERIWSVWT